MSDQPYEAAGQDNPGTNDGRRRAVVIGGVVAVVAALGFGAFILLGSSDSAAPSDAGPIAGATRRATSPSTPTALASPTLAPPAATEPNRHDPFKPLYSPKPVPTTAPPTPVAPVAPVSGTANPLPTVPGGTVGPGGSGTPGAPQNVVKLQSVSGAGATPTLTVLIDGVNATGKTGETLGGILQVVSIRPDDGAATFQLGDATFDLHIGQSYTN